MAVGGQQGLTGMIFFISLLSLPGGWYYIAHFDRSVAGLRKTQSQAKLTIVHTGKYREILFDLSPYRVELPKRQSALLAMAQVI